MPVSTSKVKPNQMTDDEFFSHAFIRKQLTAMGVTVQARILILPATMPGCVVVGWCGDLDRVLRAMQSLRTMGQPFQVDFCDEYGRARHKAGLNDNRRSYQWTPDKHE